MEKMKINLKLVLNILCINICIICVSSDCPQLYLGQHCTCKNDEIACVGSTDIELDQMFASISKNALNTKKNFKSFRLKNSAVTKLKANTFSDITFDQIYINDNNNLMAIDTDAFGDNYKVTTKIEFSDNHKLAQVTNLFTILSKFLNANEINLNGNGLKEIPSYAFYPVNGDQKLASIAIHDLDIVKLGKYAFYSLNSLHNIDLKFAKLNYIPDFAFAFSSPAPNLRLTIFLQDNDLISPKALATNALADIKRPASLYFGNNYHETTMDTYYLDERTYSKFLSDKNNRMFIMSKNFKLDCTDCRSYWLIKDKDLLSRIQGDTLVCKDGTNAVDAGHFKNCQNMRL